MHVSYFLNTLFCERRSNKMANASTGIFQDVPVFYLTEQILLEIIEHCNSCKDYTKLTTTLSKVYSTVGSLCNSFQKTPSGAVQIRPGLDYPSLTRAYNALFILPLDIFERAMAYALVTLARNLETELQRDYKLYSDDEILDVLLVVFEIRSLGSGLFLELGFPEFCTAAKCISVDVQVKLSKAWANQEPSSLRTILGNLHELITWTIFTQENILTHFQENVVLTSATCVMNILYFASILAGTQYSPILNLNREGDSNLGRELQHKEQSVQTLSAQLKNIQDCRKPLLPNSEFYNYALNNNILICTDYKNYIDKKSFSFMRYPFILMPSLKSKCLFLHSKEVMYELDNNTVSYCLQFFNMRRDHILNDTLLKLEKTIIFNPGLLKKNMIVRFKGEIGSDQGGITNEFFQLVVKEIFNLDNGLFMFLDDSQTMWFNPSFNYDCQLFLIGLIISLAVYHNVVIPLNFPMVFYKKLKGEAGIFEDLADWNPILYNSLKQLLDYTEDDFENVFMLTFRVSYQDVFGNFLHHDLIENGNQTVVRQSNKHEFVMLYTDFLLNKSVEKQFVAFYEGFRMILDGSPFNLMFRPEEAELLICGSKNYDFNELEEHMQYKDHFTKSTPIIKHFWTVVHAFSFEEKRKFLQFTTGSDRVPIGGLKELNMNIAAYGTDGDHLPISNTCMNILMLPEYNSEEKLRDKLKTAINHCHGFGLI